MRMNAEALVSMHGKKLKEALDPVIQTLIQYSLHLASMGDCSSSNMACLSDDMEAFQGGW